MTIDEKQNFIISIDEELLLGGVIISEWTSYLARDAETAFVHGANLAAILCAIAAIESHLRYEYFPKEVNQKKLFKMIEMADFDDNFRSELHKLRQFRNSWIHVQDPSDDQLLLERPDYESIRLENLAKEAIRTMLIVLYSNQSV